MKSKVLVFTSGKGGVGKTPFTIISALALKELGYKVVAVDMNFLNPDLYQIFLKFGAENVSLVTGFEGEKLSPPLLVIDIYGDGKLFAVTRSPKYVYFPYPPIYLFKSLLGLIEHLDQDVMFVVDTNLNTASFGGIDPSHITYIDKISDKTSKINFAHIVTPSSLVKISDIEELSELKQLERVINTYNRLGSRIMGRRGEGIIFVFTPTFLEKTKGGFMGTLSRFFGFTKEYEATIRPPANVKDHLKYILENIVEPYERSTRYMYIGDLEKISSEFYAFAISSSSVIKSEFVTKLSSLELQNTFMSLAFKYLYDPVTKTLPRNSLFIPYFVESMINIVDVFLAAAELNEKNVIERFGPIYKLIKEWLRAVFLTE